MNKPVKISIVTLTIAVAGIAAAKAYDAASASVETPATTIASADGWKAESRGGGHHFRHEGRQGEPRFAGRHGFGPRGRAMMRQMEAFDLNGDGAVTQAEIDQSRQDQIAKFDSNKDGSLSLEEYQALWLDRMRERMVDAFQRHDNDGDGQVTEEEFNKRFARLIERFDRNGDGQLSPDDRRGRSHRGGTDRNAPVEPGPDKTAE